METKYDTYLEQELPYKCSLEELFEKTKEIGFNEYYVLAYIRQVGARNVRFFLDKNLGYWNRPEEKILYRVCDENDSRNSDYDFSDPSYNPILNKVSNADDWFTAYKIGLIPVDGGYIKTFYVSDFCSLLDEGHIEIWEEGN